METSEESRAVNRFLDSIRAALYDIHDRLLRENRRISATTIKQIYLGKEEKQYMLVEIFRDHNNEMESLIGKGFTKGTLQRCNACKKHIEDYLEFHYKVKDIPVEDVDHQFITGFDHPSFVLDSNTLIPCGFADIKSLEQEPGASDKRSDPS